MCRQAEYSRERKSSEKIMKSEIRVHIIKCKTVVNSELVMVFDWQFMVT